MGTVAAALLASGLLDDRRTVAGQQSGVSAIEAIEQARLVIRVAGPLTAYAYTEADDDGDYMTVEDAKSIVAALARKAEALQRESAELRAVMKECHAALKMMISPGDISGSTVLGAFAAAKSAEARARALLGGENAGN